MSALILQLCRISIVCTIFFLSAFAHAQQFSSTKAIPSFRDLDDEQFVRVRLQKQMSIFELQGENLVVSQQENIIQPVAIIKSSTRLQIRRVQISGKLFWQVLRLSGGREPLTQLFGSKYLTIAGENLRAGAKLLPGKIFFSGERKFDLVGLVRLREYLLGVVSNEMPISWPLEALKAQAIAARSYALSVIQMRKNEIYQLESTVMDQMFSHFGVNSGRPEFAMNVIKAVDSTRGALLLKNKKVLKAYYHADCGGKTSDSESVFGSNELVGGVIDESCPSNPKARWEYRISKSELATKIASYFGAPEKWVPLSRVFPTPDEKNERVGSVIFSFDNGLDRKVKANQMREILGYQDLKSTQFQLKDNTNEYIFTGVGYGHGVGLCQWGSRALALKGESHTKILLHYYPEAQLNVLSLKTAKNLQSKESNRNDDHHVF